MFIANFFDVYWLLLTLKKRYSFSVDLRRKNV